MAKKDKKSTASNGGIKMKEVKRKFLVSLKRNPQIIPLLALTISFIIFSFNLTDISNTTAKIYGKHMGLCAFVAMLFSILSYVCLFNAFPKRKKPSIPMIVLALVLFAAIIFADINYYGRIIEAVNRAQSPIKVTEATSYITSAKVVMIVHIITILITAVSVVLEPVYAKLLRKITTSVEVEYTAEIDSIDISDEE